MCVCEVPVSFEGGKGKKNFLIIPKSIPSYMDTQNGDGCSGFIVYFAKGFKK